MNGAAHGHQRPSGIARNGVCFGVWAVEALGATVGYVSRILEHATPAITLSPYAHEFSKAEHDDQTRKRMEAAFGG